MCTKIAFVIQGKNSPLYRPNKVEHKDRCIVVNARNAFLTGKKYEQKFYRHHTGFPGGLKEISARHYLEKNPKEMILRSIKGMTPKNCMRPEYLEKVTIFEDGGHDLYKIGLPQFGKITPIDYDKILGISPETHTIIQATGDVDKDFPELKDYKRNIDPESMKPKYMQKPKFRVNRQLKDKLEKYLIAFRKKHHRRIRNMAYRYI
jgi:large subunit ribosomal protein L13